MCFLPTLNFERVSTKTMASQGPPSQDTLETVLRGHSQHCIGLARTLAPTYAVVKGTTSLVVLDSSCSELILYLTRRHRAYLQQFLSSS